MAKMLGQLSFNHIKKGDTLIGHPNSTGLGNRVGELALKPDLGGKDRASSLGFPGAWRVVVSNNVFQKDVLVCNNTLHALDIIWATMNLVNNLARSKL